MTFFQKPPPPPIVVSCAHEFIACDSGCEAHAWLKPEAMRQATRFVVYDPDGRLLQRYCTDFIRHRYNIKIFDTSNMAQSVKYNPFAYAKRDSDVTKGLLNNKVYYIKTFHR